MINILFANAEKMNIDRLIALAALGVSILSILWQFHTWRHQKKREDTPLLKVFIKKRSISIGQGQSMIETQFVIQNIGTCGVKILDCTINGKPITEYKELFESERIIGAIVQPDLSIYCLRDPVLNAPNDVTTGSHVKLKYKADSGKTFQKDFTLSMEET